MASTLTVLRMGRLIVFDPTTPRLVDLLTPLLRYTSMKYLVGEERKIHLKETGQPFAFNEHECFSFDHKERLACAFGFYPRLRAFLLQHGYTVKLRNLKPHPKPEIFKPLWDRVTEQFKLRYMQRECLEMFFTREHGRIDCPPGYGKSTLIGAAGLALPKARIDIVVKSASIATSIYRDLCGLLPNVGLVGAGGHGLNSRVRVFVAKSLRRSDGLADILFGDEVHELAADSFIEHLARYRHSRNFGLSASHDQRMDNKDMRIEGIFGPIRIRVNYDRARQKGMVVPIRVIWTDVIRNYDPCEFLDSPISKKRAAIWRHNFRNKLIAKDARRYKKDQVLIIVETVDHAVHLKKFLPEFTLVYAENSLDAHKRRKYIKWGLINADEPHMTPRRRLQLKEDFEAGKLKKVIATGVWNTGVNFRRLAVLIRADAGGSSIMDTQIPGRVSRTCKEAGKKIGIVHDYRDQFNRGFKQKAQKRSRNYADHGWQEFSADGRELRTPSLFDQRGGLWRVRGNFTG